MVCLPINSLSVQGASGTSSWPLTRKAVICQKAPLFFCYSKLSVYEGWNQAEIVCAVSKGGVVATSHPFDNLIRTDGSFWPPPEIVKSCIEVDKSGPSVEMTKYYASLVSGFIAIFSQSIVKTRLRGLCLELWDAHNGQF